MAGWLGGWLADVASFRKCLGTSSGARPRARASGGTCPHSDNHAKDGWNGADGSDGLDGSDGVENWTIGKLSNWKIGSFQGGR